MFLGKGSLQIPLFEIRILTSAPTPLVNRLKCFAAFLDETTDTAGIEQLSLCVRYVDSEKSKIPEDILMFVPAINRTGQGLANLVVSKLLNIDCEVLIGHGYDGAAARRDVYKRQAVYIFYHTSFRSHKT